MSLSYPHFLVNCKVYPGTAGHAGLELAGIVDRVARDTGTNLAIAPQTPDLRLVARETSAPVVAQAVDAVSPGRGNGAILPEAVERTGAVGTFVNHPETPETLTDLRTQVHRCREVGLETIVAVDSVELGRAVAALEPDCLLFEEPDDVASEDPMVRAHPERVAAFVAAVDEVRPETKVFVGGGITEPEDVAAAFELGVDATGAASAFVGSEDPEAWLREVAAEL